MTGTNVREAFMEAARAAVSANPDVLLPPDP